MVSQAQISNNAVHGIAVILIMTAAAESLSPSDTAAPVKSNTAKKRRRLNPLSPTFHLYKGLYCMSHAMTNKALIY